MTQGDPTRLRVSMVVPSLRAGGLERLVRDLILRLDPGVFDISVHCVGGLGVYAEDLQAAQIPVVDCTEPSVRIRGLPLTLIRSIARFRPHVIHAHSGTWYAAAMARTLLPSPALVYTEHGRYPPEPKGRAIVERWCARRTDRLVAVSSETAEYVQNFLGLRYVPDVLPNGVDLALYRPLEDGERQRVRAAMGFAPEDVVAISVGRFVPVKGQASLVRAAAKALPGNARLRVVFVGAGPLEADVRALTESLGIAESVRFLGFRTDVADCLGAADFFVNSSTTEGQPVSILEAMATGLPVLATRVGGVPDVLGSPPAGLLVPSGDEEALTHALMRMGSDEVLRHETADRALSRASEYSIEEFTARHADLYRNTSR